MRKRTTPMKKSIAPTMYLFTLQSVSVSCRDKEEVMYQKICLGRLMLDLAKVRK